MASAEEEEKMQCSVARRHVSSNNIQMATRTAITLSG
eukprot:CAMPEP_0201192908 /NCGR_PEP_ID=MMETSP0851-20130426/145647_1 /ASSEMBLY_ACC=CAM_ASM_000631 /TAXON_ID=183588 /ORGANISM="Pseudo-nitzschia fraudulenta, Strain WWA7" /LENGTH=36 /DNA_ID= /DNA_START= /DNA_END= /DNA_ORIENTATION=